MKHLATLELPVSNLTTYPGNARRSDMERLHESLRRTGQYRSIVVRAEHPDQPDEGGTILAGNHTFLAATEHAGWSTVRCEVIDCTEEEGRRINLVDNRLNDRAKYDDDELAELLQEAAVDGLEGTGFTDRELEKLLASNLPAEGDADTEEMTNTFGVSIECDDEAQQAELLERLSGEGWRVRALMR